MQHPLTKASAAPYRADLHAHTTASDGTLRPGDLVRLAAAAGVSLLAVTDHDSLGGLEEAENAAREAGVALIPGVELSTAGESEVHILGYFVRPDMQRLAALLRDAIEDRRSRGLRFIQKFRELGLPFREEDLGLPEGTECHRPHVAQALVRRGYVSSVKEAFDRYLAVGRPGYIPRKRMESEEVVRLLREEGAVPVLAHPGLIRQEALRSPERLTRLKEAGLAGMEAYHIKHTPADCERFDRLARSLGLLVTGGSDFHGPQDSHGELGSMMDKWPTMNTDARAVLAYTGAHGRMER